MCIGLHVKCPLFLPDFSENSPLSTDYKKILICQISWKSVQWGSCCSMRTDGQTDKQRDKTKIIVSFVNAPKDSQVISNWFAYSNWDRQCGYNAKNLKTGLRFVAGITRFLSLNSVQIGSEDHRAFWISFFSWCLWGGSKKLSTRRWLSFV
jgi:hypothetical protein